jgi:hypothetical protein
MKFARTVCLGALMMLLLVFAVPAQLSDKDPRNTAPTVGTGGPMGGPTGLFTVYDGKTLRKGEFTFSAALSNYDRDPGDVDITSAPLSFQVGLSNRLELFFATEAWRGIHVNSPNNLSSFYLPNSTILFNGVRTTGPAIVLAPNGGGTNQFLNSSVFRPTGMPNCAFPYTGCSAGTYGFNLPNTSGGSFGFGVGTTATLGPPRKGGAADLFPGVGSTVGGILPGIVLATAPITVNGRVLGTQPTSFTVAPSYLEDAPFVNRTWGTSMWNTGDVGFKWRFNNSTDAIGWGVIAAYRWYMDTPNRGGGFNMLNRGASPGSKWGDVSATVFADARVSKRVNLSFNVGYVYTMKVTGNFGGTSYVLLDRADQLQAAVGVDFPVNKHFQPILEFRGVKYVGGHTPNALENDPMDGVAGFRVYPRRWWGFGVAYRRMFNQQDAGSFNGTTSASAVALCTAIANCNPVTSTSSFSGVPPGLRTSSDPNGYIFQVWAGRRQKRQGDVVNKAPSVDAVTLSDTVVTLPCPPGFRSRSGACADNHTISVATRASDPENDVLTYNYTVSGGRIVGQGANVSWDLSGAQTGTYTITTGVNDGCGVCGKTDTQTITVRDCPDCEAIVNCSCPTLSVSGPSGVVTPGQPMTFTASSSGDVTYNWTVSAGTISSGQGTSSITVDTTGLAGQNVTATVEINGSAIVPSCGCTTTASETGSVQARPTATQIDEFGKVTNDDIKARVDGFFTQLNNNPTAQGYIINYGTPAEIKARRAAIMKAITFRKYDASRVTFIDGPDSGNGINTKFYLVPAGADNPTP